MRSNEAIIQSGYLPCFTRKYLLTSVFFFLTNILCGVQSAFFERRPTFCEHTDRQVHNIHVYTDRYTSSLSVRSKVQNMTLITLTAGCLFLQLHNSKSVAFEKQQVHLSCKCLKPNLKAIWRNVFTSYAERRMRILVRMLPMTWMLARFCRHF